MRRFNGLKIVEEFLPDKINDIPAGWCVGDFLNEIWRDDLWILKNWKLQFRAQGEPFIVTVQGVRTRKKWKLWKAVVKTADMEEYEKYQKYKKEGA